jgi:hypothetical protein
MALIRSSQLNPRFTGSFTLSGSFVGDSNTTGSFGKLLGDASDVTGITTTYDGNKTVLNSDLGDLFTNQFNAGTTGSVSEFLDAVFFPNTAPSVSSSQFTINEFEVSSSSVGTITATDAESSNQTITFVTQSGYSDDFFKIHSGSGAITLNTMSSASFNTDSGNHAGGDSHPFLIGVEDGITQSNATIYIRVTPNTAPIFRTTSVSGTQIIAQTGSVNENTTSGTTVLTMFTTDTESDTITVSPISQSADNHFSISTSSVVGGKQILLQTATASFDFDDKSQYKLFISSSDQHFGSTPSSSGFVTTLPIEVNVTQNQAPTMASQVFNINESSGSNDNNNGLGSNSNSLTTVGTIVTNDNEGDTVTFTGLSLTSGSGGGNTSQTDISNNPFQVTSNGTLQLKAGQYLNSDTFDSYKYDATYKDNFNDASSSGVITINIQDDPQPTLSSNGTFYIIESAVSGALVRTNSNGRTGTQADFNSNETVFFELNPDTGSLHINSSNGNISLNNNVSESIYTNDVGNQLSGSVTASNAFGTSVSTTFNVNVAINNSPTPSFSNTSANINTNGARPSNTITTISFTDTESDTLNHNTFTFTDPSGQLNAVKSSDTYLIQPTQNLSGSSYQMTGSIRDEHGFRTGTTTHDITIAQAPLGTLTTNGTFYIIESAVSGALIRTNSNGFSGTQGDLGVTYSPQYNSAAVQGFSVFENDGSTPHQFVTSSAVGALSIKANVSESAFTSGNSLTASVHYTDQYDNVGSGSITVNVRTNTAPSITLTPSSQTLSTEQVTSGSFITSASFTDTESDTINYDSFSLTGTHGSLFTSTRVGDAVLITTNTDLSASNQQYQFTANVKDEHGFNTGTSNGTLTVTPMVYFYKQTQGVGSMNSGNAISILGDPGGDDVEPITSGSVIANFKSGSIGDSSFSTNAGTTTLISSQSVSDLGGSTFRNFGNIDLSGNSGNGHSWLAVFPSSSAIGGKPNTMGTALGGSTADEYVIYNDNSIADAVETAGVYYFEVNSAIRGVDRFGMIHGVGANTESSQYYHLLPSSGSAPSSEL